MKIQDMKYMAESRRDVVGFLRTSNINEINKLFDGHYDCDGKSYREIADKALALYERRAIKNKAASKIIEIISENNPRFRTESHRYQDHNIFEWVDEQGCYLFLKKGTRREFDYMNHYVD